MARVIRLSAGKFGRFQESSHPAARASQTHVLMLSAILAPLSFNGASLNTAVRMQRATAPSMQAEATADAVEVEVPKPPPAIEVMRVGDKTLAGDYGFDPLGLADEPKKLAWYREAEIKHARLAMLAAAGWPLSEKLNAGSLLQSGNRVPSLLNGGLGQVNLFYWVGCLALAVAVEAKTIDAQLNTGKRPDDYLPGYPGFDPLGQDSPFFRNAEILNGRVSMIAITAFALEEAITKQGVVTNTPFLFQPPF